MMIPAELIALSTELAAIAGRKSVDAIFDKIKTVKQKGDKDEIIGNLEGIINELIADKNALIQISRAYEEYFVAQRITDDEINYITTSIVPLLEKLLPQISGDDIEKNQKIIEMIKPILSKETLNIMQIMGFNFKGAVGEPLTELMGSFLRSKIHNNKDQDIEIIGQQREIEYLKICQDEEAYNRLMKIKK